MDINPKGDRDSARSDLTESKEMKADNEKEREILENGKRPATKSDIPPVPRPRDTTVFFHPPHVAAPSLRGSQHCRGHASGLLFTIGREGACSGVVSWSRCGELKGEIPIDEMSKDRPRRQRRQASAPQTL